MATPVVITGDELKEMGSPVAHGFFTRLGGESAGLYEGLNAGLGSRDDRDAVRANRAAALAALGAGDAHLATPHQTHSAIALVVDRPWKAGERPVADAVVTAVPGFAVGILTADCGPVLLADHRAGIVAAAHAGWKGALGGILENTLAAMEALGARRQDIRAVLGPTIGPANYEVGPEFVARFRDADPASDRFFASGPRPGHAMFDLPAYILSRLRAAGVAAHWTGHCTYADERRFFSYRRATHRGEPDYGRQLSAILLRK